MPVKDIDTDNNKVNWELLKEKLNEQDQLSDKLLLIIENLGKELNELKKKSGEQHSDINQLKITLIKILRVLL